MCVWLSVYIYQKKDRERIKQMYTLLIFGEPAEEYTEFLILVLHLFYKYEIRSK